MYESTWRYLPQTFNLQVRWSFKYISDEKTGKKFHALWVKFVSTAAFTICSKGPKLKFPISETKL
jgi:hypothetical protein